MISEWRWHPDLQWETDRVHTPGFVVRFHRLEIHLSALKPEVSAEDIEHAVSNAVVSDELDDDLCLYLGPTRSASLLEVIVVVREGDRPELAIHAMAMREKYRRLLPGG